MARNRSNRSAGQSVPVASQKRPTLVHQSESFEGPVPHPSILEKYDAIVPGAANRILEMAEKESRHRQIIEFQANEANIKAQEQQILIAGKQQKYAFYSDAIGKTLGFLTTFLALGGSIYLAIDGNTAAAIALASLPLAAIVEAFRQHASKK